MTPSVSLSVRLAQYRASNYGTYIRSIFLLPINYNQRHSFTHLSSQGQDVTTSGFILISSHMIALIPGERGCVSLVPWCSIHPDLLPDNDVYVSLYRKTASGE